MNKPAVQVDHLDFAYEKVDILKDVSFEIPQHAFIAIIGPNGGGKTTLLKLMMGLLKPQKGQVLLFGNTPDAMHKCIGYVPQMRSFDKKFPISSLEVVLMGSLSHLNWIGIYPKEIKLAAYEAMKKLGVDHLAKQPFGTLSGGQAQRVLIARAIMGHPKILFLDEPTSSIDPETQEEVVKLLLQLKSSMTIVMVTHHLQHIIHDVTAVMCVQELVSTLEPKEVCSHYAYGVYHLPMIEKGPK